MSGSAITAWPQTGRALRRSAQRLKIARSLVLELDIIVLDEPTSALDVTVQAGIIEVLLKLQADRNLTYVFVMTCRWCASWPTPYR